MVALLSVVGRIFFFLCLYASWFLVEQRAATTPLQRTRFWLVLFSSAHVFPAAFISASVLLRQVCFGRPTLRFPCGFQLRACLVMLNAGFRSVWPIQPHLRFLISISVGVCFVLSHSCPFEITSGRLMLRMFLRHPQRVKLQPQARVVSAPLPVFLHRRKSYSYEPLLWLPT